MAAGQGGHAALTLRPVAGWGVEQYLREAVILQARGDFGGRVLVGKQEFDGLEARLPGGREAVQERDFAEHHR